jgi:Tfp pilus assembly protein PilX
MRRRTTSESGAALVLLLGITATLAILAATAVFVLANQQGATAAERAHGQSFNYAEAGLDSAVMAVRTTTWPAASAAFPQATLTAAYDASYPSGSRPPLTVKVYDNQATINEAITWDQGGPAAPNTPDGKLWVEASVTYGGKTSRVRTLIGQVNSTSGLTLPKAAFYTDGNISTSTGDVFALNAAGQPDTTKAAAVFAQGKFTGGWGTNLWPAGSNPSPSGATTLDVKTNGTVTAPELGWSNKAGTGGVPALSTYLPQTTIDTLAAQAKQGTPTQANANGTVANAALISQLQLNQGKTTDVPYDLVVNGNLSLASGTANFRSLYVTGNLSVGSAGAMHATSLYVGGTFTVSGTDKTQTCGPTYVAGNVSWNSNASVETTDYLDSSKAPAPLYVAGSFTSSAGPFYHKLGPTYVGGAVTFSGNNAQILCPLFVTDGKITTSGSCTIGTVADPVMLVGLNDTDGTATSIDLNGNGMITGLIVNMDGGVNLGNSGTPYLVRGAVFSTGDITYTNGGCQVCYDPNAMGNLDVTASTSTTNAVPGTWQELSPNGN